MSFGKTNGFSTKFVHSFKERSADAIPKLKMPPAKENHNKRYKVSSLPTVAPRTRRQHAIADCEILKLNDDCLLEIFSYLDELDLCAVKDSCRRFNVLATLTVQNKWKGIAYNVHAWDLQLRGRRNIIIRQHFGQCVENVNIMTHDTMYPERKPAAKIVWAQLKHFPALKKLSMYSAKVERLPICHVKVTLQNLTSLFLRSCEGDEWEFARIINACKNLAHLNIYGCYGASISLLPSICHKFSNIEVIDFTPDRNEFETAATCEDSLAKLQNLRKLKSLTLYCGRRAVTSAIAPLAEKESMECVILQSCKSDEQLVKAFREWAVVKATKPRVGMNSCEFHRHSPTVPIIS